MSTREKILPDILKDEQVEAAKHDRSHPAVQTFDEFDEMHWEALSESLRASTYGQHEALYLASIMPYAETLEGKMFGLGPLDLVSIWSRVTEVFTDDRNARYALSRAMACVYGTATIESEDWKHLFKMMEDKGTCYLFDLAEKDGSNAIKFRQRIFEIRTSLRELEYYARGTREDVVALVRKADSGNDKDAEERLEQVALSEKAHDYALLREIRENWGNGITPLMLP